MDLDLFMIYCRIFISKINTQVLELHRTADDKFDIINKIKIIFGSKINEDL